MVLTDNVQITSDNANVFNGRLLSEVPDWARRVRIQVVSTDSDTLFSCTIGGVQLARDSGPHAVYADNTNRCEWTNQHIVYDLVRGGKLPTVLVDVNIVTGGVVNVHGQLEN